MAEKTAVDAPAAQNYHVEIHFVVKKSDGSPWTESVTTYFEMDFASIVRMEGKLVQAALDLNAEAQETL